jgi:hypothetical protein
VRRGRVSFKRLGLVFRDFRQRFRVFKRRRRGRVDGHHNQMLARFSLVEGFFHSLRERKFIRAFKHKNGFRVRIFQVISHFARLEQNAQRHDRRARFQNSVINNREKRQIRTRQRDFIAVTDVHFRQRIRHAIR